MKYRCPETLPSSRLRLLEELFVKFNALFREAGGVERNVFQKVKQRVDLTFSRIKLVHDDDLLIFQYTVARLEISLFVTERIVRFGNEIFKFGQKLRGVFNHSG